MHAVGGQFAKLDAVFIVPNIAQRKGIVNAWLRNFPLARGRIFRYTQREEKEAALWNKENSAKRT